MPNMRATIKVRNAIIFPLNGTVQVQREVGDLGTGASWVCDWGVMLWDVGVCNVEGAALVCNGMEVLVVCDLDDPVCCWLDVSCTAAMDARMLNSYGFNNRFTFVCII